MPRISPEQVAQERAAAPPEELNGQYSGEEQLSSQAYELPDVSQWDYKTAPVGPHGENLPEGAQQWKPDGKPYFGEGFKGKLKEYWWNYTKDIPHLASVREMSDLSKTMSDEYTVAGRYMGQSPEYKQAQKKYYQNISEAWKGTGDLSEEEVAEYRDLENKRSLAAPIGGGGKHKTAVGEPLTEEELARMQELEQKGDPSLLSGARRGVNVGVQAGLDLFQVSAQKTEQSLGAVRGGGEELAKQAGMEVGGEEAAKRAADLNAKYEQIRSGEENVPPIPWSEEWAVAKDNLRATLISSPPVIAYNAIKVALSPSHGNWDTIKDKIAEGWDSGRIMYTQAIDPMVRFEYERRLAEGENPELLAMELQDPWAEMAGQLVLDPLNLIGSINKAAKFSSTVDDQAKLARALANTGGEYEKAIEVFAKVTTKEGAETAVANLSKVQKEAVIARDAARAQKYGVFQLTSTPCYRMGEAWTTSRICTSLV